MFLSRFVPLVLCAASLATAGCTGLFPIAAGAPPLTARPGCSLWAGTIKGNDRAAIELELCPIAPDGERVAGRVQLKSPRSGWSVREVEGELTPNGDLVMRDLKFDVYEPEFGWIFCLIDQYELTVDEPGRASGHYDSTACSDHAAVRLRRMR